MVTRSYLGAPAQGVRETLIRATARARRIGGRTRRTVSGTGAAPAQDGKWSPELARSRGYLSRLGFADGYSAPSGEVGGGDAPARREGSGAPCCAPGTSARQT